MSRTGVGGRNGARIEETSRLIDTGGDGLQPTPAGLQVGERVRILYHGGSQPGSVREVVPISFTSTKMRARDVSTGQAKVFSLKKVELASKKSSAPVHAPVEKVSVAEGSSIDEAVSPYLEELKELGWAIYQNGEALDQSQIDSAP